MVSNMTVLDIAGDVDVESHGLQEVSALKVCTVTNVLSCGVVVFFNQEFTFYILQCGLKMNPRTKNIMDTWDCSPNTA